MYLIYENSKYDEDYEEKLEESVDKVLQECTSSLKVLIEDINLSKDEKDRKEQAYNQVAKSGNVTEGKSFKLDENKSSYQKIPKTVQDIVNITKDEEIDIKIDTGPIFNPHMHQKYKREHKRIEKALKENDEDKKIDPLMEIADYLKSVDKLTTEYIEREIDDHENLLIYTSPLRNLDTYLKDKYDINKKNERIIDEINEDIRQLSLAMK